ncbi:MAG: prepilin-type N-terminal cleavage/methylation domain-containing protein [Acidobacteriota bacterium]|nr:prepilin-type N-terminal cleavage/methylation domain-containing protein [Acidobacteriota bacterium]
MKMRRRIGSRERGLTYIELIVVLAVIVVLAAAVAPINHWREKRQREEHLRMTLQIMRDSIDMYKRYVDEGLITQSDLDQQGYPRDLEELVEGVEVGDPSSPDSKTMRFLVRIPIDPITGEAEWGLRSYQDDWDSTTWGGENVYDVYSLSDGIALDGSYYAEW